MFMIQKANTIKYCMFMIQKANTIKVKLGSFLKARIRIQSQTSGSGSDQKGSDLTGSGSATLTVGLEPEPLQILTRSRRCIKMMHLCNTDLLPFKQCCGSGFGPIWSDPDV
jgi:hypothetical protein